MTKEIKIECNCGHIITIDLDIEEFEWEIIETDEREMGIETLYEATFEYECNNCNENLKIALQVWEYPEGFINLSEVNVEGGIVKKDCDLGDYIL